MKTAAEYKPYAQRSRDQLARIESEVMAKHRKAIVVVGGAHVVRRNMRKPKKIVPLEDASLGDALARKYPGRTYAVWTVPGSAKLSTEFAGVSIPSISPVAGTPFAARSFGDAAPAGITVQRTVDGKQQWIPLTSDDWPPIEAMCDALLFLGPSRTSEVFGFDLTADVKEAAGKAGQ